MNRQQRRRAQRSPDDFHPSRATVNASIRKLHEEASGVMVNHIIRPTDALELMGKAIGGDAHAANLLSAANQIIERVRGAPSGDPMQCTTCRRPLRDTKFTPVIAVPMRNGPKNSMAMMICHECATALPDLHAKALQAVREIWPDARAIDVTHSKGGHA